MTPAPVKQLDFLPDKYRHATRRRRTSYWRFVVIFLFIGVFAAAAWGMHSARSGVRREFEQVTVRYLAAQAHETALQAREARLGELRSYADLVTFLRYPWPRSQILNQLFAPLPASVIVDKLRIGNEPRPVVVAASEAGGEAAVETAKTATTDLAELRKGAEANDLVIRLEGTALDQPGLHAYLHQLTSGTLFRSAEVESIESARSGEGAGAASSGTSKFIARIVVRSGWGLPDGPTLEEMQPVESTEPAAAETAPTAATTGADAAVVAGGAQ